MIFLVLIAISHHIGTIHFIRMLLLNLFYILRTYISFYLANIWNLLFSFMIDPVYCHACCWFASYLNAKFIEIYVWRRIQYFTCNAIFFFPTIIAVCYRILTPLNKISQAYMILSRFSVYDKPLL